MTDNIVRPQFRTEAGDDALRKQPHNVEAEMGLLGAILLNNELFGAVADFLKAEDFYAPENERLFALCAAAIAGGKLATPPTLRHVIDADPILREAGGLTYVASLALQASPFADVAQYGRVIQSLALKRRLIEVGEDARDAGFDLADLEARDVFARANEIAAKAEAIAAAQPDVRKPMPIARAIDMAIANAEAVYKAGDSVIGVPTGLRDLDRATGGLRGGSLIVLAGVTKIGKTTLALSIGWNASTQDFHGLMFNLESQNAETGAKVLAMLTGIPVDRQRSGPLTDTDIQMMVAARRTIEDVPLVLEDNFLASVSRMRRRAVEAKRKGRLHFLIVDYLQLLAGEGPIGSRTEEVARITRGLKQLASDLDVPVIALSQLSRRKDAGDDSPPQLYELKESGSIEQDADLIMFVHRREYHIAKRRPEHKLGEDGNEFSARLHQWHQLMGLHEGKGEIIIAAHRHGPAPRVIPVLFDGERSVFTDAPLEAQQDSIPF